MPDVLSPDSPEVIRFITIRGHPLEVFEVANEIYNRFQTPFAESDHDTNDDDDQLTVTLVVQPKYPLTKAAVNKIVEEKDAEVEVLYNKEDQQ